MVKLWHDCDVAQVSRLPRLTRLLLTYLLVKMSSNAVFFLLFSSFSDAPPAAESGSTNSEPGAGASSQGSSEGRIVPVRPKVSRRTTIPPKPNISLNLWSILSNCIGKELTKIPMPVSDKKDLILLYAGFVNDLYCLFSQVNFSEPLSMLQRLSENFEYSYVLDRAAACTDPVEQLAYVSAFVVSSYASTACRVNKPFNPLLNETYECDRTDDLGWRAVAEQVR